MDKTKITNNKTDIKTATTWGILHFLMKKTTTGRKSIANREANINGIMISPPR
jgi:hypothetical protein